MKKILWSIALTLGLVACRVHLPPPPPPPPAVYTVPVAVFRGDPAQDHKAPGAQVRVDGCERPECVAVADGAGNAFLRLPAGSYSVCAALDGYEAACALTTAPGAAQLVLRAIVPPAPAVPAIRVDGKVFRDETGQIWSYKGFTAFTLLQRFAAGEDIGPYLDRVVAYGANTVRVLATMRNIVNFPPSAYSDDQLRAFLVKTHQHGLRVELVALADAQDWPLGAQRLQVQRVLDAVAATGRLDLVEVANEPFKNSAAPQDVMSGVDAKGVVLASGDYTLTSPQPTLWHLSYQTIHNERKDEWPRTAKDALEIRDGFDWKDGETVIGQFQGVRIPVVSDEPMGADEVNQPGRRATNPDDFFWFAVTSRLFSAGATFHSTAGITSSPLGPVQDAAAKAFFAGLALIPPDVQTGQYTRGYLANCPLEHDDALALRTFCSLQGGHAWCVAIRPAATWKAQARDGWQIKAQFGPRGTVIELTR